MPLSPRLMVLGPAGTVVLVAADPLHTLLQDVNVEARWEC